MINFGTLEYQFFEFLEARLAPAEFVKMRDKHFKDRLTAIRHCLISKKSSPAQLDAYDQFSTRAEKIRVLRNHIAHGYIFLKVPTKPDSPPFAMLCNPKDIYSEHLPSSTILEFADLQKTNANLCELIKEFRSLTEATQH
jgi:hypothetical protein